MTNTEKPFLDYYRQFLLEAQDYNAMFNTVLTNPAKYTDNQLKRMTEEWQEAAKEYVLWARKNLKKNDRIVWFLRWARYEMSINIGKLTQSEALMAYNKSAKTNFTQRDVWPIPRLKTSLEHFASLEFPAVQNVRFDRQSPETLLSEELPKAEEESIKKVGDDAGAEEMYRNKRLIEKDHRDDVIMRFPDGYAWVDLHQPSSREEGDAMGHCGNRASYKSGETILSLRKTINYAGKQWWYPVVTFILDDNDQLGEMKGRNNQKPQSKYHPYIVALIKSDHVSGIKGGGYMPANNFSLHDLGESEKDRLIEEKPELAGFRYLYEKEGLSKKVLGMLSEQLRTNDFPGYESHEDGYFVVETWRDLERFLSDIYDRDASKVLDVCTGDSSIIEDLEPYNAFYEVVNIMPDIWQDKIINRANEIKTGINSIDDAIKLLYKEDDYYFKVFKTLLEKSSVHALLESAWERLREYMGWSFYCYGAYTNIPTRSTEELKQFVQSNQEVKLMISDRDMMEIATYEGDDYPDDFDPYQLKEHGWASINEDSQSEDRRWERGILNKDYEDEWLNGLESVEFKGEIMSKYISALEHPSSTIQDPRQGELMVERIKKLAGLI